MIQNGEEYPVRKADNCGQFDATWANSYLGHEVCYLILCRYPSSRYLPEINSIASYTCVSKA